MSAIPGTPTRALRTRIKFCGFTRARDLREAVRLGVDALGLVFDPASRRALSPAAGAALRAEAPPFVSVVALFRDSDPALIEATLRIVQPDLLQFHGQEPPEDCERWQRPYLKAVPMVQRQDLSAWARRYARARGLLLDGHAPGAPGGAGRAFDWSLMDAEAGRFWVLAGGLHPGNVSEAVTMARPGAVDVSSGIESAPGLKDFSKMKAFVDAVCAADGREDQ